MKKFFSVFVIIAIILQACFLSANAFDDNGKKNLLVLGDSIAAGTGIVCPEECCYGALIAKANDYNYCNTAFSGANSWDLVANVEYSPTDERIFYTVQKVIESDIILISIGGNDLLGGDWVEMVNQALFDNNYAMINLMTEWFYENIKEAVMYINEANPDATVLIQTLYNPRFDVLANVYQHAIDNLNQKIYQAAQELPGYFYIVDVASCLGRNPLYYSVDTLHPSKLGHYRIAKAYLNALNELGLGEELIPPRQPTAFEIPDYFDRLMEVIEEYLNYIEGFLT